MKMAHQLLHIPSRSRFEVLRSFNSAHLQHRLLDLEACIFEVEVPFDAASRFVTEAALISEFEHLSPLRAQQLSPETLICLCAFLVVVAVLFAVFGLSGEAGGKTTAAKLVEVAHPLGRLLANPLLALLPL